MSDLDATLAALLARSPACRQCHTRANDPHHPARIAFDIDLDAEDYGESGRHTTSHAHARLVCTNPRFYDHLGESEPCDTWISGVDLDQAIYLAEAALAERIAKLT